MKFHQSHLKQLSLLLCNNTAKLLFIALSLTISSSAIADANADSTTAYVDSIHQWGAWELDIAPAAGGLQPPVTSQALNARNSRVTLRTNSVSALAPRDRSPVIFAPSPAPTPTAPPLPVTPPIPTITPINPNVPIPIGNPGI